MRIQSLNLCLRRRIISSKISTNKYDILSRLLTYWLLKAKKGSGICNKKMTAVSFRRWSWSSQPTSAKTTCYIFLSMKTKCSLTVTSKYTYFISVKVSFPEGNNLRENKTRFSKKRRNFFHGDQIPPIDLNMQGRRDTLQIK